MSAVLSCGLHICPVPTLWHCAQHTSLQAQNKSTGHFFTRPKLNTLTYAHACAHTVADTVDLRKEVRRTEGEVTLHSLQPSSVELTSTPCLPTHCHSGLSFTLYSPTASRPMFPVLTIFLLSKFKCLSSSLSSAGQPASPSLFLHICIPQKIAVLGGEKLLQFLGLAFLRRQ